MVQRLGIASLDDARKRRKRRRADAADLPEVPEQPPKADAEDYSSYALDLAGGLLGEEPDVPAGSADAILAQHEAASNRPSVATRLEEGADAPADEILAALEAHHQRTAPRQRHAAPRGSAELDPAQPQLPRAKAAKARAIPGSPRFGRRPLVACGIAAALVAIAITVSSSLGGTTPRPVERQAVQIAGDYPTRGLLRAPQHHVPAETRAHRPHRSTHHAKRPAVPHRSASTSSSSPASSAAATQGSSSVGGSTANAVSSGSTATVSGSQGGGSQAGGSQGGGSQGSSASSSSAQPAGPAGPGGTVGGNCNPKCS